VHGDFRSLPTMKVALVLAVLVAACAAQTSFRVNSLPTLVSHEVLCNWDTQQETCAWMPVMEDPINLHVAGASNKRYLSIPFSALATIWTDAKDETEGGEGEESSSSGAGAKIQCRVTVQESRNGRLVDIDVYPAKVNLFEMHDTTTLSDDDVACIEKDYVNTGCNNGTASNTTECCPEAISLIEEDAVATSFYFIADDFETGNVYVNIEWRVFYSVKGQGHAGGSMGPVAFEVRTGQMEEQDACMHGGSNCQV